MEIKQWETSFDLLYSHTREAWEAFIPMRADKKERLFHALAEVNDYPDLTLWYIESNREIRDPETRSFWWETGESIVVLDSTWKYTKYSKEEYPNYWEFVKKFSQDENMIWVSEDPSWKDKFWRRDGYNVILKEGKRKIKLKVLDKNKNKEEKDGIKCDEMTVEEIEELKKTKKSKAAQFFYEKNDVYKPRYKIILDDWNIFYISKKLCTHEGYNEILWYVMKWGELKIRMFYRSGSEGVWRSCSWLREDSKLSKWEHIHNYCYETTTKVTQQLWSAFDSMEKEIHWELEPILSDSKSLWNNFLEKEMIGETTVDALFNSSELRDIIIKQAENIVNDDTTDEETKERNKKLIKKLENYKKNWHIFHSCLMNLLWFHDENGDYWTWDIDTVKHMYEMAVPSELDYKNMNYKKSFTYQHEHLWIIKTDVYQASWMWEKVNIHFSRAEETPNKVWIDDIQYSDADINSFWILGKSINAAPLVWKPIDYWNQTPYNPKDDSEKWIGGSYADIRDLYQENPIIKHYKQIQGLS